MAYNNYIQENNNYNMYNNIKNNLNNIKNNKYITKINNEKNIQYNLTEEDLNNPNIYSHSYGLIVLKLNNINFNKKNYDNEELNLRLNNNLKKQLKKINVFNKNEELNYNIRNPKHISLFSLLQDKILFLLISKKHTYGFVDLINGKYSFNDTTYIFNLLKQITPNEYNRLMNENFIDLWKEVNYVKSDEDVEKNIKFIEKIEKRFNHLKEIIPIKFNNVIYQYNSPDWEFPKGKKKNNETDLHCAYRELREETGLKPKDYTVLKNIEPFQEIFRGTDNKLYHYTYYFAVLKKDCGNFIKCNTSFNLSENIETSKIGFFSFSSTLEQIRHYYKLRKYIVNIIFKNIYNLLLNCYNDIIIDINNPKPLSYFINYDYDNFILNDYGYNLYNINSSSLIYYDYNDNYNDISLDT